jgi:hypothetical protein
MTNQQHSITVRPELMQQWRHSWLPSHGDFVDYIAAQAAQWAADQELEACCEWLNGGSKIDYDTAALLRAARRPKPPSLKKQAYAALDTYIYGNPDHGDKQNTYNIIRRALEALPE